MCVLCIGEVEGFVSVAMVMVEPIVVSSLSHYRWFLLLSGSPSTPSVLSIRRRIPRRRFYRGRIAGVL